jgi:hypothetical protein
MDDRRRTLSGDNSSGELKKKGQNTTTKSQSCVKIVKLPIQKLLVFFFARQGLSGPYQIRSSDMDLIILVL